MLGLIRSTTGKASPDSPLLEVNFDTELIALLREVKYMLSLGLKDNIPAEILQLYEKEGTPVVTHGIRRSESFNFSRTLCSEQEQRS